MQTGQTITVALAGNPNCGKTVLFNALTGSHQRVGNWPGVTVERKSGCFKIAQQKFKLVDLPGVYSLSVVSDKDSVDAQIACDYLHAEGADILVNIIDASNLERNLYLTLQLLELKIPMILVVNMMDVVQQRGMELDLAGLQRELGCPVVAMVASRGAGMAELKNAILAMQKDMTSSQFALALPSAVAAGVENVASVLAATQPQQKRFDAKWLALRLLEDDQYAWQQVSAATQKFVKEQAQLIEEVLDEEPDILIADARYGFINQLSLRVMRLSAAKETVTQKIDRLVLHRWWGIPIFFGVMYLMFVFAINIGGAFQDFFDIGSTTIFVSGVAQVLTQWHVPNWLIAILAHGVGMGINTTITFIPVIGAMFLFLAFLEDCGYMARAAFVMDRLMRAIGLPGKSFVPMIVGFGCNVPAVMGARALANRRDRILTIMMMPFMSCGARLAIFAVFVSAFFPKGGQDIIFGLYLIGVLAAVGTGLLLRKTLLPGEPAPLVMELPPYHLPRVGTLFKHAWLRLKRFITRAGKVIVPVCVIIGALNSITLTGQLQPGGSDQSVLSAVGRVVTPVLEPMGVQPSNWPATVGLATGVLAKEVVIGTLNKLYSDVAHRQSGAAPLHFWQGLRAAVLSVPQNLLGLGAAFANPLKADEAPHAMNRTAYGVMYASFASKAAAFAYLLFVLLYFPCVSTMAAIQRELNRRWAVLSVAWNTGLAYVLAVVVYQLLTVSSHVWSSLAWVLGAVLLLASAVAALKFYLQQVVVDA